MVVFVCKDDVGSTDELSVTEKVATLDEFQSKDDVGGAEEFDGVNVVGNPDELDGKDVVGNADELVQKVDPVRPGVGRALGTEAMEDEKLLSQVTKHSRLTMTGTWPFLSKEADMVMRLVASSYSLVEIIGTGSIEVKV